MTLQYMERYPNLWSVLIREEYAHTMWHSTEKFPRIRNYAYSAGETRTGGNFRLSHAAPRQNRMTHVITQPHKLQSQLVVLLTAVITDHLV
jgi:hypothetical protein